MKLLCCAFALTIGLLPLVGAKQDKPKPLPKNYAKGRVAPKNLAALYEQSHQTHGRMLRSLPKITAASWDCRTLGLVPPITDQGQCGSCWNFSGTGVVTSACIKAGWGKADGSFMLSEQYTMDCGRNGGCDGDDNTTVTAWAKTTGLPSRADYGPYTASSGNCKSTSGMTLYKLADWGFCTASNQNGVASTQDIKNAMVAYGPIGSAIAADDAFSNVSPGEVFSGNSQDINHDIILVGWDDSKGAWILRNSWGTNWCDGGYCWIKYGANSVGTEAIWATAQPGPTPPPGPVPPGPIPPGPLPPGPAVTLTLTPEQVQSVIAQSGAVTITGDMTLREVLEALDRARARTIRGPWNMKGER